MLLLVKVYIQIQVVQIILTYLNLILLITLIFLTVLARFLNKLFHNKGFQENAAAAAKSLQSCPTLCDPIEGSPPGSPVPGIFQARVLEWGAIDLIHI